MVTGMAFPGHPGNGQALDPYTHCVYDVMGHVIFQITTYTNDCASITCSFIICGCQHWHILVYIANWLAFFMIRFFLYVN